MTDDHLQILCTGDLHLGRHPTRIPAELDGEACSPKSVWRSIVDTAKQQAVDAVLISGDIVDRENRYFEAFGPFEDGICQLGEADIPAVLVTGNHDFDSLPSLVDSLEAENVRLLGHGGTWERETITADAGSFHVDGWSFPQEHVHTPPFDTYEMEAASEPVLGLLHGDFGVTESEYAPISQQHVDTAGADAWVLGHIHTPGVRVENDPLVFYPGSPQPLHPGEAGGHGPWMLEIRDGGRLDCKPLYHATIRYDELSFDVSELADTKALPGLFRERVEAHLSDVDTAALDTLLVRASLTGQTEIHREFIQQREAIREQLQCKVDTVAVRIKQLNIETKQAVELAELASDETPVAYLARLLRSFEGEERPDGYGRLLDKATDAVQEAYLANTYTPLRKDGRITSPDSEEAEVYLEQQARLLLDELLEQQEGEQA